MEIEEALNINNRLSNVIHNGQHFKSSERFELHECSKLGGLGGDDIWWCRPVYTSIPGDTPQG